MNLSLLQYFLILGNLWIPISNMMPKYVHISAIVVFSQFDTPFCTAYLKPLIHTNY